MYLIILYVGILEHFWKNIENVTTEMVSMGEVYIDF